MPSYQIEPRNLSELIKLLSALRLPGTNNFDALFCTEPTDLAAIDAVFSGTVAALNIDRTELAKDVLYALSETCPAQEESNVQSKISLAFLPSIPVKPDWKNASTVAFSGRDLVLLVQLRRRSASID